MLGGPYKRVKEPLGGMIRGALATGGTGGATQPRQEYATTGQAECNQGSESDMTRHEFPRGFPGSDFKDNFRPPDNKIDRIQ